MRNCRLVDRTKFKAEVESKTHKKIRNLNLQPSDIAFAYEIKKCRVIKIPHRLTLFFFKKMNVRMHPSEWYGL